MQKKFNSRPMCFFAALLTLGVIIAEIIYPNNLFVLIPLVVSFIVSAGLIIFRKSRRFAYLAIAFFIGTTATLISNTIYDNHFTVASGNSTVQAKVVSEIIDDGESVKYYVDELIVDGRQVDGKALVKAADYGKDFSSGDVILLKGYFSVPERERFSSMKSYALNHGVYYFLYPTTTNKLSDGEVSFPTNFQLTVKQMFYENMDEDVAQISQALILGDKSGIDETLYENVKTSGLAHALAVSGLHITALATAVFWLLKRLKVNPKISFAIVTVLTFLYAMLCSFTPSAVRAFIMSAVFNFAGAFGLKRDNLSALSFATAILLIINPFNVMDAGFLLSMSSMLGIFLFYRPIESSCNKVLLKANPESFVGKKVSSAVSSSLSANLMTFPFVGYFFGSVPLLFVFTSIVLLPYLMFIWLILLINTAFALITTLWSSVGVMNYLFYPFLKFVGEIGSIKWASAEFSIGGIVGIFLILWWTVSCVLSSKFVFLSKWKRVGAISVWTCISAVSCVIALAIMNFL